MNIFFSSRSISTKKSAQGAQPGQDQARGLPRARTPSVSTSMGTRTKTTVASWDKHSHQQMDSNLSQIAMQCN